MDFNLYFSKKEKTYFKVGGAACFNCGDQIENTALIKCVWRVDKSLIKEYCINCMHKAKVQESKVTDLFICVVCEDLPILDDLVPVFLTPPTLKKCNLDSMDAISDLSHCKVANHPLRNVMTEVNLITQKKMLEDRDMELNAILDEEGTDKHLNALKHSKPLIGEDEKKQIS